MSDYLLGIDIGTSSAKCILVNAGGNVVAETSSDYHPTARRPGYSEQDPEKWYRSAAALVRSLLDKKVGVARGIVAVGVTGQMRGVTFIGGSSGAIRDSILWNDLRCINEVDEIREKIPGLLSALTRNPLNTMCTLPKVLWVMREEPEVWNNTARIIFPKDYITYRLTGSLQTDHSDASGSSFYDLGRRAWSPDILDAFSIGVEKLPPIVASDAIVGTVTKRASTETGIPEGTPVVAGGSDAVTELLAARILSSYQCKIRLGTSGALSTVIDDINTAPAGCYLWSYVKPGRWMLDINTRSCAQATAWLRDLLYGGSGSEDEAFKNMEDEARDIPLGSDGLVFHPYLMGEDAPYWNPGLRASFWGLTAFHKRGHIIRAVYEGTAFALNDALACLKDVGEGFSEYILVGGGTKNRLWTQIVLDVLGVDGTIPDRGGSSLGAAILAGVGSGVFRDLVEAVEKCRGNDVSIAHSPENHNRYMRLFERYKRIKGSLDSIYDIR